MWPGLPVSPYHCSHPGLLTVVLLLGTMAVAVYCEDLYKTLGVSRSAGLKEIKNAYKRMAKQWCVLYYMVPGRC